MVRKAWAFVLDFFTVLLGLTWILCHVVAVPVKWVWAWGRFYGRRFLHLPLLVFLGGCYGCNTSPGDNEKIGVIVSLHDVGIWYKTHEATLVRGGFTSGSGANGITSAFTIESDSLNRIAKSFMDHEVEVRVRYRTEGWFFNGRSESGGNFAYAIDSLRGGR